MSLSDAVSHDDDDQNNIKMRSRQNQQIIIANRDLPYRLIRKVVPFQTQNMAF